MRVVVIGLGVQGRKRLSIAGSDVIGTVDPYADQAQFQKIETIPLDTYDAALVCTPDTVKIPILQYLLFHSKHVLVEKPLISEENIVLNDLQTLAEKNCTVCYTAYNHRFEPHIVTLKQHLDSAILGQVYLCKFFYGNGTARDVRNSAWRDEGMGVFPDLGSHLLDWTLQLFTPPTESPDLWRSALYENKSYDHFQFGFQGTPSLDYEMTLLSWRNTFRLDLFAEKGSAHIDGLCKWGPSTLTIRKRVLPSGRPTEFSETIISPDSTWQKEYEHFKMLCQQPVNNIANDLWINSVFQIIKQKLQKV